MRGKRSKQYRKLMQAYGLTFGFREPYQVVVDAEMIHDAHSFAMDLPVSLARTLHGDVKVMITSCSIRHLYAIPTTNSTDTTTTSDASQIRTPSSGNPVSSSPTMSPVSPHTKTSLLNISRTLTLRKCGHHVLDAPLSTLDCLRSVVDPKERGVNRHRIVLGVQDPATRQWVRNHVSGVPSVYVKRSVMILEPMSILSERVRAGDERGKLSGSFLQNDENATKRKRADGGLEDENRAEKDEEDAKKPRKKSKRPKGPNPLSMKKKKPKPQN